MEQFKNPSTFKWTCKLWCVHTAKYYTPMKKKEPPHTRAWMNLTDVRVSEKSYRQKNSESMSLFIHFTNKQNQTTALKVKTVAPDRDEA